MNIIRDPIPVAPFLAWCDHRLEQLAAEHVPTLHLSKTTADRSYDSTSDPQRRLLLEMGWTLESGERRLRRWRKECVGGMVARAGVEDALHRAGVRLDEVYPDLPEPEPYRSYAGRGRHMTDRQVVAAHTLYTRQRHTLDTLGELLYREFGYKSAETMSCALSRAFRGLGLPIRQCTATRVGGAACDRAPLPGVDACVTHAAPKPAYELPPALAAEARAMRADGTTMAQIARTLLDRTPYRNVDALSNRLREVALRDGWRGTRHCWGRRAA